MFAAGLIVFREVFEAALIISIILAATVGLRHRGLWAGIGIAVGLIGAGAIAGMTEFLAAAFDGMGQDVLNASILFLAVGLIGWHIVWMNSHGREIASTMRAVGQSVMDGEKHLSILAIVIGLAVMREGAEVVLMLQGLWASGAVSNMVGGALFGLVGGVVVGALLYFGLLQLPIARVFASTNIILMLIASGMAARAGNILAQADILPTLAPTLWDTSAIIPDSSIVGQILAGLIGYVAKPSGLEVLFYSVTLTAVLLMTRFVEKKQAG